MKEDFLEFIKNNAQADPNKLRLSVKKEEKDFDIEKAILQIECRKKYSSKLKNFIGNDNFMFPDSISGEQASHQSIGAYHSNLAAQCGSILDMTAGLGIDSFSFAVNGRNVVSIELDPAKTQNLISNIEALNFKNISVIQGDSIDFLKNNNIFFDLIFIDPSRRDKESRKVYNLKDCSPNVIEYQDLLLKHSDRILIKASPLLDISQTIRDFPKLYSISAIGIKGECKEILIELRNDLEKDTLITVNAINLDNSGEILSQFSDSLNRDLSQKSKEKISYSSIDDLKEGSFILEPSAMVMKLSFWGKICSDYNSLKLGKSSHLFISKEYPKNFPGRVTKLIKNIKTQDRKSICGLPASVVSKNHPLSPEEIRKKFQLKEGDQNFIYATRLGEKPVFLLTQIV